MNTSKKLRTMDKKIKKPDWLVGPAVSEWWVTKESNLEPPD